MLVHRSDMSATERTSFEQAIRACGKDPHAFKAELFEAAGEGACALMRRVHVVTLGAAALYEASAESAWTDKFARHLALGVFG